MKFIIFISLVLLAGCGTYPTLDQLEAEALMTGDWSAVEKRESVLERRNQRAGPKCPDGYIGFCSDTMIKLRCTCIKSDSVYSAFSRY